MGQVSCSPGICYFKACIKLSSRSHVIMHSRQRPMCLLLRISYQRRHGPLLGLHQKATSRIGCALQLDTEGICYQAVPQECCEPQWQLPSGGRSL